MILLIIANLDSWLSRPDAAPTFLLRHRGWCGYEWSEWALTLPGSVTSADSPSPPKRWPRQPRAHRAELRVGFQPGHRYAIPFVPGEARKCLPHARRKPAHSRRNR